MNVLLKNQVYDSLKWICLVVIPAISVLYTQLAGAWGWPYVHQIATTFDAVSLFLGALIGVSTYEYKKKAMQEVEQEAKQDE